MTDELSRFDQVENLLEGTGNILDHTSKIWTYIKRLLSWASGRRKGKSRSEPSSRKQILIIGSAGTGKSTLGALLSGNFDFLLSAFGDYKESHLIETYTLSDDRNVDVMVLPGQHHRRPSSWPVCLEGIRTGVYRGIIVVNSFGYHQLRGVLSYKSHPLWRSTKTESKFLASFLRESRKDEVQVLRTVSSAIRQNKERMWLVSLVGKQDLWWNQRTTVERSYRTGNYGKEIEGLITDLDPKRFRHDHVFASLLILNFETGNKELLRKTNAGYDHKTQIKSWFEMFRTLDSLRKWEEE